MEISHLTKCIRRSLPELDLRAVEHLYTGQFNTLLLVNEEWVFRFPRYAHGIHGLERQAAALNAIRPLLPLATPEVTYVTPGGEVGEVFAMYRYLPGAPLYRSVLQAISDEAAVQRMAEQAAGFLRALHAIEVGALQVEVPVEDPLDFYERFTTEARAALLPRMRPDARAAVEAQFERLLYHLRSRSYRPCLVHNDFGGSNILYDEARRELSAVIDFSSLALGDPAVDVASLSTYGEDFVLRGLRVYPEMEALLERARLIRATFALEEALSGWKDGDAEAFRRGMENYV